MSVVVCDHCERYIDSDDDPYCFIENPYDSKDTTVLCEYCREKAWDQEQDRLSEDGPGPSLLDQQKEAMKLK